MTPVTGRRLHLSVFLKCIFILTVATAIVAGVIAVSSDRAIRNVALDGLRQLSIDGTETLANRLIGPLRFRKTDDVSSALESFGAAKADKVRGSVVIFLDGTEVVETGSLSESDLDQLRTLAQATVATGNAESTFDGFWRGQPIVSSESLVGAVAVAWSPAQKLAIINAGRRDQMLVAGGVFALLTLASGLFFRHSLAQPLKQIASRTTGMAEGDLTTSVPHATRRDEIGQMSAQLEALRERLHAAERLTRDAHFKGAGFHGASTPLVLTDPDFQITHLNPAFAALLKASSEISEHIPDLVADDAIGVALDLAVLDTELASISEEVLPITKDIAIGTTTIALTLNDIRDADGRLTGYVMEWNDVSEARVTEAVLSALEAAQLRADFSADGSLKTVNGIAAKVAPTLPPLHADLGIDDVLSLADGSPLSGLQQTEAPLFNTFRFASSRIVSGILSPIHGPGGQKSGYVFLGHDITDSENSREAAKKESEQLERDQAIVVSALNLGLNALAAGDLTIRLREPFPGNHETLRTHFNASIEAMEAAVGAVRENSRNILSEADNIAGAADDLSRRTEHQAATLEEFAASLTQLTASVAATADGAGQASEVVTMARANAESSGVVVQEAVEAMGEISGSSERIGRIISVIDDIAFQTNLLALNAGVEAARAGDAGRGFAVVASEVRALAQRSSDAAREINELISSSSAEVRRGVSLVGRAGEALETIVGSIGGIAEHVSSIAASAREQSTGIDEINSAMSQLDQTTQQNVAMFEETTAATHALRGEASSLVAASQRFTVTEHEPSRTAPKPTESIEMPAHPSPKTVARNAASPQSEGALALNDDDDEWEDF